MTALGGQGPGPLLGVVVVVVEHHLPRLEALGA